jgi:hypothetical protein
MAYSTQSLNNRIGFASIDIGARRVALQLMLSSYDANCSLSNASLSVHKAKKRSEVAPGVGANTDMILIQKDGCILIKPEIVSNLDKIYKEIIKKESNIQLSAKNKVDKYITNILERKKEKQHNFELN